MQEGPTPNILRFNAASRECLVVSIAFFSYEFWITVKYMVSHSMRSLSRWTAGWSKDMRVLPLMQTKHAGVRMCLTIHSLHDSLPFACASYSQL